MQSAWNVDDGAELQLKGHYNDFEVTPLRRRLS